MEHTCLDSAKEHAPHLAQLHKSTYHDFRLPHLSSGRILLQKCHSVLAFKGNKENDKMQVSFCNQSKLKSFRPQAEFSSRKWINY